MTTAEYEEYVSRYNLGRFTDAHRNIYDTALMEIQSGKKLSHWMWYIFPQLRGLGHSRNSDYYGIADRDEAIMFLHHPLLYRNLREITMAMLAIDGKSAEEILGGTDALKFRSSMTLFNAVCPDNIFAEALHKYYGGEEDERTLEMLKADGSEVIVSGGIIGAIIGDIIGSVYEGYPCKSTEFELFPEDCMFTDDTVMTVAVADWLLSGDPLQKTMPDWGRIYPNRGYGGMFRRWLFSPDPGIRRPYNSFGNGAAMRVSPCGYYAGSLEEALELAGQSAEVTHNHPEGIKGAQAVASAIFMARQYKSKDEIRDYIETTFGYNLHRTCDEIRPAYRFDVTCQGSCPEAIIAFLDSHDYESSIRLAVSLGGDSDTIACMTGGIAAACYGIPSWMVKYVVSEYLPRNILDIIGNFDELCAKRGLEYG